MMIVADKDVSLLLSGTGDVIESDDGILAIGSGGPYANSAAKALIKNTKMNAKEIAIDFPRLLLEPVTKAVLPFIDITSLPSN